MTDDDRDHRAPPATTGAVARAPSEDEILEAFRRDLAIRLPDLLGRAIRGYARFAADPSPDDARGFTAYQSGCRAALAHVHLLIKLAQAAGGRADAPSAGLDAEHLERIVREAEAALRDEEPGDD